ncbi:hypothetical protein [Paraburkholderia bannensis]|uniref:hypothetical protein n=1 Tax=Paraburkholderia bannensis TaxID=765414 RepID=UPI002AC32BEA|nr:hypothetical protein [Paraburkholderia bannensis]
MEVCPGRAPAWIHNHSRKRLAAAQGESQDDGSTIVAKNKMNRLTVFAIISAVDSETICRRFDAEISSF